MIFSEQCEDGHCTMTAPVVAIPQSGKLAKMKSLMDNGNGRIDDTYLVK